MAKKIRLELSSSNEDIYFDSYYIINQLLNEKNIYPSSQKRITMSDFLFALKQNDKQIGFVSAFKDDRFYSDVLSLDLCLLKSYRSNGIANKVLPRVVLAIEQSSEYNDEFIIIEKSKSHDDEIKGIKYSDDIILLQDRLEEINYTHPDGIERGKKVVSGREAFFNPNNKGRK